MSTTPAAKPLRFFVWKGGSPSMACAAGYTFEHARDALCEKLAQDPHFRVAGETYEIALAGWLAYFNAEPYIEMVAPGAYYVEASAE
jgi:hypothetical protein